MNDIILQTALFTANVINFFPFFFFFQLARRECFGSLYSYARSHLCLLLRLSDSIDDSR